MALVVILTGAGISAESGIPTFRDQNGLWENHDVGEVATPKGWMENPKLVWRFYQERRRGMQGVEPNAAHRALVDLEKKLLNNGHGFYLITQNIDGLDIKAGIQYIVEMHGALRRFRCEKCDYEVENDYLEDDLLPCPECGWVHLRPDVVWFDEMPHNPEIFLSAVNQCTHFVSIGTSGEVYPAAHFIHDALRDGKEVYYQNTDPIHAHLLGMEIHEFQGKASEKVPELCSNILKSLGISEKEELITDNDAS